MTVPEPKAKPFSYQKHKSQLDLQYQVRQFTRHEKTSPLEATLSKESIIAEGNPSGIKNLKDILRKQKLKVNSLEESLIREENPSNLDEMATKHAFEDMKEQRSKIAQKLPKLKSKEASKNHSC